MLYKTRKHSAMTLGGFRSGTGKYKTLSCAIKNRLDRELDNLISGMDKAYSLGKISPLLVKSIKEFVLRDGKRIRPLLFIIGYLGFTKKAASGLYKSALSMELLHDFMLIHDDIIDKSATRRGKPSMHALLNNYLKGSSRLKFSGEDLAIVLGDVVYAMAINAFLYIKEEKKRKERALKKFVEATMYTGTGEFIELIYGIKKLNAIKKEDIYKVYDFKTAYYSFASPLAIGAILAGASQRQVDNIFKYGICLGRAFQIKDDIICMFDTEEKTGKSSLTDLQEGKKTLLVWYAYNHCSRQDKTTIKNIFRKEKVDKKDFLKMRGILIASGALDYSKKEISCLMHKAGGYNEDSGIKAKYKKLLHEYCAGILKL
ncbi:MAG: polyprenyl synthetase family protein [Candidatus Omnitrophota bacterium]